MIARRLIPAVLILAALAACSRSLSQGVAEDLVRAYLAPFKVKGLTFKSMTRAQVPGAGDGYMVVADFVVPYQGKMLQPLPGQTFYITFNENSGRYEVNPQLTHVAQGIQGMIDVTKTAGYMKTHPYNPSPWNPR
ncbi:MAG: hypothetical protein ACOYXN_08895 [Acidobacteriota bacterium]